MVTRPLPLLDASKKSLNAALASFGVDRSSLAASMTALSGVIIVSFDGAPPGKD
jgi:hypothetical protein